MSPRAMAEYLSEQLRLLRAQLSKLEQVADELVIAEQPTDQVEQQPEVIRA